jgi:hypothetical protein
MKDNFKMIVKMEKVFFIFQMDNLFKEILSMILLKDKVYIQLLMEKKYMAFGKIIILLNYIENKYRKHHNF